MAALFYFFGLAAIAACGYFGWAAITMEVPVDIGQADPAFPSTVANFQLMHVQAMNMQFAIGLLVTGAILMAAGGIIERMDRDNPIPPSA